MERCRVGTAAAGADDNRYLGGSLGLRFASHARVVSEVQCLCLRVRCSPGEIRALSQIDSIRTIRGAH